MFLENNGKGLNVSMQVLDTALCHNGEVTERRYIPRPKTKEEFLENHFLGYGKEHKKVDDFLGDFVALSTSSSSIKITNDYYFGKMKKASTHCGLTKNEMLVPIITIEKE